MESFNIPDSIKTVRKQLGLTQAEFARMLNICKSNISKYENGQIMPPADVYLTIKKLGQAKKQKKASA